MKEVLYSWEPAQNIPTEYYIEEIKVSKDQLTILLHPDKDISRKIFVIFDYASVIFYRHTNDSFWLCPDLPIFDVDGTSILKFGYLRVEHSKLVQSLLDQRKKDASPKNYLHFIFIDSAYFEVITTNEPRVEGL